MKKITLFLIFLLTAGLLAAQQVTIERITGKVQISSGGAWANASNGDVVAPGSIVSTGFKSTAVLNTGDATVEVAQLTRLTLEELIDQGDAVKTTLFLNGGKINAEVSRERVRQDFTVRSPIATASVRGTGFAFDGRNLSVTHGAVLVVAGGGTVLALPGDSIRTGDGTGTPPSRAEALAEQTGVKAVLDLLNEEDLPEGMSSEGLNELISSALLDQLQSQQVILGLVIQ